MLDAKKDFEKVLEVGYLINGYDVLPKHSDIDISRALRKEFLKDPESISELISLRLILFFELRYLNKKFEIVDKDYERINLILKNWPEKQTDKYISYISPVGARNISLYILVRVAPA